MDDVLRRIHSMDSTITIHKLTMGEIPLLRFLVRCHTRKSETYPSRTASVNVHFRLITPRLIRHIHKKGKTVFTWTVNDAEMMEKLLKMGVDGMITDFPALALQIRKKLSSVAE